MSPIELINLKPASSLCPLQTFVACAHQMLDPATPESVLRLMEPKLLAQLPALRALGVFELFEIRDPSLRAWLDDELAKLTTSTNGFHINEMHEQALSLAEY
ncbi:hypothetical protein [Dyella subtropica]|uniref:hypothetical protein n=1 Tax=Dyella subtropica TaxID=2992127 RepID=UPI00225B96FD|nr:hypothetical protein [Dyella subtropica]